MKFDLKSVLNIRTTPPSTPPPPQVVSEKANKGTKVKPESKQSNKRNSDTSNNSIKGASKPSSSDPDDGVNNQKESENPSLFFFPFLAGTSGDIFSPGFRRGLTIYCFQICLNFFRLSSKEKSNASLV